MTTPATSATPSRAGFRVLPLAEIRESPANARRRFDQAALDDLALSIRAQGILTPLLVRPVDGHFEIVAGARRYRAALQMGLEEVPVLVRDAGPHEALESGVVENLQREDIAPLDEARAFKVLLGDPVELPSVLALAERIGKPKGYVWDRLQLLQLVPTAQELLERERITVQHAIRLARLTPDQQERVIEPYGGGLFTQQGGLAFRQAPEDSAAEDRDEELETDEDVVEAPKEPGSGLKGNPFAETLKPVSLRELDAWIAKHIRFDVAHAAAAAPLDFGEVAERVQTAADQPGRGQKVIPITHDSWVDPGAKADGERTYCAASWKRADGEHGSQTCERSVLGLVVVGPEYGAAFPVCIHKDCDVHWGQERRARERRRAEGDSGSASAARKRAQEEDRKRQELQRREMAQRELWRKAIPALRQAAAKAIGNAKIGLVTKVLFTFRDFGSVVAEGKKLLPRQKTSDDLLRLLLLGRLMRWIDDTYWGPRDLPKIAKPLGLDVQAIVNGSPAASAPSAGQTHRGATRRATAKPRARRAK